MSEAPSIRESLTSAMDALSAGVNDPAPAPTAAPVAEAPAATAPEPVAAAEPAPAAGQPRDPSGKFAAKTPDAPAEAGAAAAAPPPAATQQPEPAAPAQPEPQSEAIRVPPSLPAAVKAKFADLDPDVQSAFAKLEESVQTAKAEWGRKGERLNRYDEILGPRLERWRISGLDEFSGIQALLAAQDYLERNPAEGLAHIARSYGVDLRSLAGNAVQQQTGMEAQRPTIAPELQTVLQPLVQQVQALQQQLQVTQQQSEQQKLTEAQAEVQAFANDPKNIYFENVRGQVAAILQAGQAQTLSDAYQMAIWASPEVRPLLLAEQAKAAQAEAAKQAAEQAARTKAAAAQAAAGSVTGAPAPGAQAPQGPVGSIRESLVAAARESGWQV